MRRGSHDVLLTTRRQLRAQQARDAIPRAACRAIRNANISVANNTITAVQFNVNVFDTDGIHSTSVTPERFVIQTGGIYTGCATIQFAANATGLRRVQLRKNGLDTFAEATNLGNSANENTLNAPFLLDFVEGDYIEVRVWQSSGAALNVLYTNPLSPVFWLAAVG